MGTYYEIDVIRLDNGEKLRNVITWCLDDGTLEATWPNGKYLAAANFNPSTCEEVNCFRARYRMEHKNCG